MNRNPDDDGVYRTRRQAKSQMYWDGYWDGIMVGGGGREMTPEESKWCKDNKIFECGDKSETITGSTADTTFLEWPVS